MNWRDLSIGRKLALGFALVLLLGLGANLSAWLGLTRIGDQLDAIGSRQAPHAQAALQMQVALETARTALERFMGQAALDSGNHGTGHLDALEGAYRGALARYEALGRALVEGGRLQDGTPLPATDDPEILALVRQARERDQRRLRESGDALTGAGRELVQAREARMQAAADLEGEAGAMVREADDAETVAKERVERNRAAAMSLADLHLILQRDVPLIDAMMEVKAEVVGAWKALENVAQSRSGAEIETLSRTYRQHMDSFAGLVDALRRGGEMDGETIDAVTYPDVLEVVDALAARRGEFEEAASRVIDNQTAMLAAVDRAGDAARRLHAVAGEASATLARVASATGAKMQAAAADGAATQAQATLISLGATGAALALSLGVGVLITRSVSGPLGQAVDAADAIAGGDLGTRLPERRGDEIGRLLDGMGRMRDSLRCMLSGVSEAAERLRDQARQLTETASRSSGNVAEQHSRTLQVAAALEQMAESVREVAHTTADAARHAAETDQAARGGAAVVAETVTGIEELVRDVDLVAETLATLEEQSESIGDIVDVIRGITEQTNLLALNAAIESARAGVHGRGFAVVADEVRALANRTHQFAGEISEKIEQTQAAARRAAERIRGGRRRSEETVRVAGEAGEALGRITQAAVGITDMTTRIAGAAEQQSMVAATIRDHVSDIKRLGDLSAGEAGSTAEASADLSRLADALTQQLERFRLQA